MKQRESLKVKLNHKQNKELDQIFEKHSITIAFLSKVFGMKSKYRFKETSAYERYRYAIYHIIKKITL